MNKYKLSIGLSTGVVLTIALSACGSLTGDHKTIAVNDELVLPPSLKSASAAPTRATAPTARASRVATLKRQKKVKPSNNYSNRNYYVVVGTYPSPEAALDTFTRLSSIGLSGATMESRRTKSGKNLHMVRLGPYQNQEDIDKVKDSLTSDGLSQFKVVEN